jgi:hypothetical protein
MFDLDHSRTSDESHAAMLGRVEASILGESALIDRETGRVYWEGGGSTTLYETFGPKLDQYGLDHVQAALLTGFITLVFMGVLAGWLRRLLDQSNLSSSSTDSLFLSLLLTAAHWTIMRLPRIENKWLVFASVALYFVESYYCSTRFYLANALSSPAELEDYINRLREEKPVVTWKVSSFHYEKRRLFALSRTRKISATSFQGPRIANTYFHLPKRSSHTRLLQPTNTKVASIVPWRVSGNVQL